MTADELRRQGMADAVLLLVASKRLLSPLTRSSDVCAELGLSQAELQAALDRLRARHGAETKTVPTAPERRWEVFRGGNRKPRKHSGRWTDIDERVFAAVQALGKTRPAEIHEWLKEQGAETPYGSISTSLRKQFQVGRLANPRHGLYEVA